ncbi:HAD family hydrolase [Gordonia sputi]
MTSDKTGQRQLPPLVLADLDETVLNVKSLLRFGQYIASRGLEQPESLLTSRMRSVLNQILGSADTHARADANAIYFSAFAGTSKQAVDALGTEWFELESQDPEFYNARVVTALSSHREEGAEVWLVTGSLSACADLVVAELGLTGAICTRQEADARGVYNGHIGQPCIGRGKAIAVCDRLLSHTPASQEIWAYADHHSDVPLLALADRAVCVNPSRQLAEIAEPMGWETWLSDQVEVGND